MAVKSAGWGEWRLVVGDGCATELGSAVWIEAVVGTVEGDAGSEICDAGEDGVGDVEAKCAGARVGGEGAAGVNRKVLGGALEVGASDSLPCVAYEDVGEVEGTGCIGGSVRAERGSAV